MSLESPLLPPSISAMTERYPSLEFCVEEADGCTIGIWEGWLQPIRTLTELNSIVCDLDEDRPVKINRDSATIEHSPVCDKQHVLHKIFSSIKRPDRSFLVRVEYAGSIAHPQAFLLEPEVTNATRRHIFGENRICAYPPWTDAWQPDKHNVADFTDHVLIWLFKWNTWVETGHWLGSEAGHESLQLYSSIAHDMQCWCGSGKRYGACCRPLDRLRAGLPMQEYLALRSPLFQFPNVDFSKLPTLSAFLSRYKPDRA